MFVERHLFGADGTDAVEQGGTEDRVRVVAGSGEEGAGGVAQCSSFGEGGRVQCECLPENAGGYAGLSGKAVQ